MGDYTKKVKRFWHEARQSNLREAPVVASEARQSKNVETHKFPGLLRRFAPRNDGRCA